MDYRADVASIWDVKDATERIAAVERFLNAHTQADYEKLCGEYPQMFGWGDFPWDTLGDWVSPNQTPEDIKSVCELLQQAVALYSLRDSGADIDAGDLMQCGITPVFAGIGKFDDDAEDIPVSFLHLSYHYYVRGDNYTIWLARASEQVRRRFKPFSHHNMAITNHSLVFSTDPDAETLDSDEMREACSQVLEQLINIHLADIATVCEQATMRPEQIACSGISALWLGLGERLAGGRAYRCEACDKPCVAYGERRRKQFCCDACKKWANKHPGEKRTHWYIEQR